MKKLIATILILSNIIVGTPAKEITITEYKSEQSEIYLWETLNRYTKNEKVTAGILAMYWRESYLRSDAVAGWGYYKTGDLCKEVTEYIDAGLADGSSHDDFIELMLYKYGGYGLCQLSGIQHLETFYDFAQYWGTSIADAEMQCAFTVFDLLMNFENLWIYINSTDNVEYIAWNLAVVYDGTTSGADFIAEKAQYYYELYKSN